MLIFGTEIGKLTLGCEVDKSKATEDFQYNEIEEANWWDFLSSEKEDKSC